MFYFLSLIFILAPTYLIRYKFGSIGINLLEILVAIFLAAFIFWLIQKKQIADFRQFVFSRSRKFLIATGLFLLAGLISAIVSPVHTRGIGLFIVYFLEPVLLFFPASYLFQDPANKDRLLKIIFAVIGIFSLYGIIQYFTRLGLPVEYWGNSIEPKRIVSFFDQPNSFALWLGPLLGFTLPFLTRENFRKLWIWLAWILGALAIVMTLSRGSWVALLAVIIFYIIFSRENKIRIALAALVIILAGIVYAQPVFRYRIITALHKDSSTQARFSYANVAENMIKSSPIWGQGLYGFATNFARFSPDPAIEGINLSHNIFLNFWVETGLLGLLSFVVISIWAFVRGFKNRALLYGFGLCLSLIAIFVHGLADNPYFLNALALEYWLLLALGL